MQRPPVRLQSHYPTLLTTPKRSSVTVQPLTIIGGGLAGCEAAWQAARRGVPVTLHEMRPAVRTPIHETHLLAELVCSNSLRSERLDVT